MTVPGNRPWTESKRSKWALVSTGPRSLMPTTSISVRPDSAMARSTLRPIRPNPLIATRIAMLVSPLIANADPAEQLSGGAEGGSPGSAGRERTRWKLPNPFSGQAQLSAQALQSGVNRSLAGNSEVLVKVLGAGAGPQNAPVPETVITAPHCAP